MAGDFRGRLFLVRFHVHSDLLQHCVSETEHEMYEASLNILERRPVGE